MINQEEYCTPVLFCCTHNKKIQQNGIIKILGNRLGYLVFFEEKLLTTHIRPKCIQLYNRTIILLFTLNKRGISPIVKIEQYLFCIISYTSIKLKRY